MVLEMSSRNLSNFFFLQGESGLTVRNDPPITIGEGSSAGLRDPKLFSSNLFEKTSEYDYLFKILLLGTVASLHYVIYWRPPPPRGGGLGRRGGGGG